MMKRIENKVNKKKLFFIYQYISKIINIVTTVKDIREWTLKRLEVGIIINIIIDYKYYK